MTDVRKTVEFEVERDNSEVTFSLRTADANLVLTLPLSAASVFAAATTRATAEDVTSQTFRFHTSGTLTGKSLEEK